MNKQRIVPVRSGVGQQTKFRVIRTIVTIANRVSYQWNAFNSHTFEDELQVNYNQNTIKVVLFS